MNTGFFVEELEVIEASAMQFQAACKEELDKIGRLIEGKGAIAPADYPVWHRYPFGEISYLHEVTRWIARARGLLQGCFPNAGETLQDAIMEIVVHSCMWLAWRNMQAITKPEPIMDRPEDITGPEPEPEPEPETKPKRRLSLRRLS